jgi:hypothetical protein
MLQSKKRGLSLEEKRDKVLEVFHEAGDVFVLKVKANGSGPRIKCRHMPQEPAARCGHAWGCSVEDIRRTA